MNQCAVSPTIQAIDVLSLPRILGKRDVSAKASFLNFQMLEVPESHTICIAQIAAQIHLEEIGALIFLQRTFHIVAVAI
jgi:hypothetical protein